jgi:hypothetical protein
MSEPDCSQQAYAEAQYDHDYRKLEADNERLRGLLREVRAVSSDRGIVLIDAALAGAAVQPDECPACGRSTKRHPGYVLGNHWLESAYERICAGEAEDDVLRDYDVVRVTDQASAAPEAK